MKKSRSYIAGYKLGLALVNIVELFYQNATQRRFYDGLYEALRAKINL